MFSNMLWLLLETEDTTMASNAGVARPIAILWSALVGLTALSAVCCGSGSGNSGPVAAPSPPSSPGAPVSAAAVYVGGPMPGGVWDGMQSHDATSGTMRWVLTQNGSQVTGDAQFNDPVEGDHAGPFAGTVSGSTLTFNFSVGMGGLGCGNALSGTATVGARTLTGTWSGHNCAGRSISSGQLTLSLPPGLSATRMSASGSWTGGIPPAVGGGSWTWVIAQDGDVTGGNLSGSITVSDNNTLKLGAGSFTGRLTNMFPGDVWNDSITITASFNGACPSNLQLSAARLFPGDARGNNLSADVSGTTCNGSVPATAMQIFKQ
jgi:hypothetical protein